MRGLLLPFLLAIPLVAQDTSLAEGLERPLLYARVTPSTGDRAQDLLQHPVLVGLGSPLTADGDVTAMLGDLAARTAGPVEIAWTGTIPAPPGPPPAGTVPVDLPLLVFRAELDAEAAARLTELLAAGRIAAPHRRVGSHRTYLLAPVGSGPAGHERPGKQVEVVLSGSDLLVSNHGRALEEVLGAARLHGPALVQDPDYLRLRHRLEAGPGAVEVFADVRQLLRRAPWDLRRLPLPRHALAVLEPKGRRLSASLILDFGGGTSWSAALQPARAGELLGSLRGGGLVLSLAADVPLPRGGRGVGSRTGADRSSGRRGRSLLEVWERAGRALGVGVHVEQKDDLRLLLVGGKDGKAEDPRPGSLLALLRDLEGARHEVVLGMFALSAPARGGGGMRVAGSLEPEGGAEGGRLLRVRALCVTDE